MKGPCSSSGEDQSREAYVVDWRARNEYSRDEEIEGRHRVDRRESKWDWPAKPTFFGTRVLANGYRRECVCVRLAHRRQRAR